MRRMNKPFRIRVKIAQPLTFEEVAAKYKVDPSDAAKVRALVIPFKSAGWKDRGKPAKETKRAISSSTRAARKAAR